jgi:hypothetical protein
MKHTPARTAAFLSALTALLFCAGCSPAVVLDLAPEGSAKASFAAEMSPTAGTLVRRLSGSAGQPEQPLYDRDAITASLAGAGLKPDSLLFPSKTGLSLSVPLRSVSEIPGSATAYDPEKKRLTVTLSPETVSSIVAVMPAGTRDYLDLLMAPVFTGEKLGAPEYEEVLAAAYGKTLAAELGKSEFSLTVRCPAAVKSASITPPGKAVKTGSTAAFRIPLADLLALTGTLSLTAEW